MSASSANTSDVFTRKCARGQNLSWIALKALRAEAWSLRDNGVTEGHEPWAVIGLLLVVIVAGTGAGFLRASGRSLRSTSEWLGIAVVSCAAFWMMRVYFYDGLIGAGDSYHYTLQVADYVTQVRTGIFPVLVGQSEYAFNGNVHTVRTAPYFTHFAGALDLITARQLSFFLLKNLTVILSAWGGAFAAYVAVRTLAPRCRVAAVLISLLYITAPGVLAPLMSLDMYATFMTAPWLPLFFLGCALSLQRLEDGRALLLSVFALAMIWYAHPPIAAWLSPMLLVSQAARVGLVGWAPGNLLRPFAGALLCALLTAYLFYSVYSLHLAYTLGSGVEARAGILASLQQSWPAAIWPMVEKPESVLQLGYALWLCLLISFACIGRSRIVGACFGASVLVWLVLLVPLPGVLAAAWSLVPPQLLTLTNIWPAQRFYPLLSGAAIVWLAVILGTVQTWPWRRYALVCVGLALAVGWSWREINVLQGRAEKLIVPKAQGVAWLDPENLTLTRSSYLLFNKRPAYYSDGWVDPEFESRLLGEQLEPLTENSTSLLTAHASELAALESTPLDGPRILSLDRTKNWLLVFTFANSTAPGEVSFNGALMRSFSLPNSGELLAFGSTPEASHTLTLRARPGASPVLGVLATVPGASLKALSFNSDELPVRLLGLTPYRARVRTTGMNFLETPLVYLPGYAARVNGREASVRQSRQGLVAVLVPAGESTVSLTYPGPTHLRAVYFLSLAGFLGLPLLWFYPRRTSSAPLDAKAIQTFHLFAPRAHLNRRWVAWTLGICVGACAILGATVMVRNALTYRAAYGSVRLTVNLPPWTTKHSEPLVVTGRTGAADSIYLIYDDPSHVRIGFDHWGKGGPISEPIAISRGFSDTIEITMGSLYPPEHPASKTVRGHWPVTGAAPLRVTMNGKTVLQGDFAFHPAATAQTFIATNPVGSSTSEARFTGEILKQERFVPEAWQ